ncbi:hypothetical protein [Absidia glauca]|uniref:Uncharacterized protein n=1 Tax=Absidia glauca TaxID=4829 RepID=A0A168QKT6_ABSGL|nr:hypothetical protein [Absidia glauca]
MKKFIQLATLAGYTTWHRDIEDPKSFVLQFWIPWNSKTTGLDMAVCKKPDGYDYGTIKWGLMMLLWDDNLRSNCTMLYGKPVVASGQVTLAGKETGDRSGM